MTTTGVGFRAIMEGHEATRRAQNSMVADVLGQQLMDQAVAEHQRAAALRNREQLLAEGRCTPAAEVFGADQAEEIDAFLKFMATRQNRGSVVFAPAKPKRSLIDEARFVISGSYPAPKPSNGNGNGAAQQWAPQRGFVIGTLKYEPSSNWTSVEQLPRLAVLLTNGTIGSVESQIVEGRIAPNLQSRPEPLMPLADGSYELPATGFYTPTIDLLHGAVEVPEDVAAILPERRAGSAFMHGTLDETLAALANGGRVHESHIQVAGFVPTIPAPRVG